MKNKSSHTDSIRTAATRVIFITAVMSLSVGLSACANMSTRDKNTAIGAGTGAVAGAVLTGGSTIGTVIGAGIGGAIGNNVK